MSATERQGNWLQTVGGRAFFPLDPRPEDIDIEDIAHALSFVCRFGGHCREFYSVAEHSVRVSHAIAYAGGTPLAQLSGLLHDAAEAYIGDMVWPLKQDHALSGYKQIEQAIENAISRRFEVPFGLPIVKRYDLVLLSTEKRDLMRNGSSGSNVEANAARERLGAWHSDYVPPLDTRIDPWSPKVARAYFLSHFNYLKGLR